MVALGTAFAVVFGKEVFGGTGMNIMNPALTARAFLFFAYPAQLSGDVWTYLGEKGTQLVDNYSGATALSIAASTVGSDKYGSVTEAFQSFAFAPDMFTLKNLFIGNVPGSIGETSALMCLIGAVILIMTGVGSWRIMLSMVLGGLVMGYIFNMAGSNVYMKLDPLYHLVMGGFAFGAVFMATDPVSASQTTTGKYIYGFFCGLFAIMIRVFNPAYPEGVMLAILLMNVFAPLIDYVIVNQNKKRRLNRATV
jgi:Na+-transporting NADH:ubiquinone oxidoreductase subunit B